MNENKQMICDLLLRTLQATRNLHDLVELLYDPGKDVVIARFSNGCTKKVNVACDSGTAMIMDIVKHIV